MDYEQIRHSEPMSRRLDGRDRAAHDRISRGAFSDGDRRSRGRRTWDGSPRRRRSSRRSSPTLVERFARDQLRAAAQVRGSFHNAAARGPVRVRAQRRPQSDGGSARASTRQMGASVCAAQGRIHGERDLPAVTEAMNEIGIDISQRVPQATDRHRGACRRCGHNDGLRRLVPRLPRQALPGLGDRRPGRSADSRSFARDPRRDPGPCRRAARHLDRRDRPVRTLVTQAPLSGAWSPSSLARRSWRPS